MTDQPTTEQQTQALLVQQEIAEVLTRLIAEGIDYRVILAGLGAATASAVAMSLGVAEVPRWFEAQARITRDLGRN